MIGIIKRPNMPKAKPPFNPDDYFDPITHIATEANFIKLLEDGIYTQDVIGYGVTLGNSLNMGSGYEYNNGVWIIADVNHDSANTGQSNCYDLISKDCFLNGVFSSSDNFYRGSGYREVLFYLAGSFSDNFKSHMLSPKYNSDGSWYQDDYAILPSFIEVNGNVPDDYSSYIISEGVKYPIFESGSSSRIKNQFGGSAQSWWTRSRNTGNSKRVWIVIANGVISFSNYSGSYYIAPILRVS